MGKFTEDMTRLRENIDAGHASREEMVSNLGTDVDEMMTEFGRKRVESKKHLQSELNHFTEELGEKVIEMRKGFHQERTQMIGDITLLKDEVREMQTRFKREHAESSKQFRTELKAFRNNLSKEVCDMQDRFNQDRNSMKAALREALNSFVRNDLKPPVENMLQEFRSDREGAHNAWLGKGRTVSQPKTFKPQKTFEDERKIDDLTLIPGIGAHREEMLNQKGICTFAQLSKATPEQLVEIIGGQSRPSQVEKWISKAETMGN